MKKTPLYEIHRNLGGKMIDFGGWELPVQYSGIIDEHQKVRIAAGIFDVSHMGEIVVRGRDAESFLQKLITNDISKVSDYQVVYSPVCYPCGGIVDDLLIYKYSNNSYLLVVNASNTEKDFAWMQQNVEGEVEIENISTQYAQLAIQGPYAEIILQKASKVPLSEMRYYHFRTDLVIAGAGVILSRTGYTGEDGFEIYLAPDKAVKVWETLLAAGKEYGMVPAGLGARDTLRFEAALPLYGQEISQDISPLEAGLERYVKFGKEDFIGKESLIVQKEKGLSRMLTGFEMLDRGIPRSHYEVEYEGRKIGFVTSGSFSPTISKNIGLALIDATYVQEGSIINIMIRGSLHRAKVVKTPFYSKKYKK